MTEQSTFTDEERALWHRARRLGLETDRDDASEDLDEMEEEMTAPADMDGAEAMGGTCVHCGTPLREPVPMGYEGALCEACE